MVLSPSLLQASTPPTDGIAGWAIQVMETLGSPGVALLVALESIFPPIPSEIVLPLAGFTASLGSLSLVGAIVWSTTGSVVGAWALYWLGVVLGRDRLVGIVDRMPLVDVEDVLKAEAVFNRHGRKAVLFGRLLPMVRSLISIPAGLERMPFLLFSMLTLIGSLVWNSALVGAGYALGQQWHVVQNYVGYLQVAVVVVIVAAVGWYVVVRIRRHRAQRSSDASGGASAGRAERDSRG